MKTENKMIVLMEIVLVLCSVFLVTLPAIAAEQTAMSANTITTASEDDYVLGVYGNANEDDTIDMRDLTYVKLIFFGKKPVTELADAKYDGKINPLDFIQIKLIIVGKEKEITIVDTADRIVTVKKPVEKIAAGATSTAEAIRALEAKDKVVAISTYVAKENVFFPELSKLPAVVGHYDLDYEEIYELNPDVYITYAPSSASLPKFQEIVDKLDLAGIKVLGLGFYKPSIMKEELKKLGYILDKEEKAEEFIDFYEEHINNIEERVKGLSEIDKPLVYCEGYKDYHTHSKGDYYDYTVKAGGINIAADMPGTWIEVDPEWVIDQNPEIIVKMEYYASNGYGEDDPSEMKAVQEKIMNRPELANVRAVKNKNVYVISTQLLGSARHFIGIAYQAKWFHPVLFEDLDPKAIHQEYLTRFQGLDYDLDEHGVFVYPEPS